MDSAPFDLDDNLIAYEGDNRARRIALPLGGKGEVPARCLIGVTDFSDDASVHADRWERHPAGDETLCVLEGRLLLSLEDDAGRDTWFTLDKGSAFIVPQGTWHRLQVLEPGRLAYFTPRHGSSLRARSDRGDDLVTRSTLDGTKLQAALDHLHRAGMPGAFAEVREGNRVWRGAAGVADVATGRAVTADMRHRVGSITKTFTAAAVLQQVEKGQVDLDAPIARYLPRLVPGERGETITVRMLINHTSGLADYLPHAYPSLAAFPSLAHTTPESLDTHRFTHFHRTELIAMGVAAPAVRAPGGTPGVYSNTNYLILCELLAHVTGGSAESCITRDVIERAGLRDTELPSGPEISGPHSRMYEAWFGMVDPPRDYSVFDMSWVGPAASLVSTVADLNRFYKLLLAGEIVDRSSLLQMQRTVPVISFEGRKIEYGLGLHKVEVPGHGTFWGHDGTTWGAGAMSMIRADGQRQMSMAVNLMRWNRLDAAGKPRPHPIDDALAALYQLAMCGSA